MFADSLAILWNSVKDTLPPENKGLEAGLKPTEIGPYLGRPASSVAKLIDEWLYATITGGLGPGEPEHPRWAAVASEQVPATANAPDNRWGRARMTFHHRCQPGCSHGYGGD